MGNNNKSEIIGIIEKKRKTQPIFNPYVKENHMEIGARSASIKAIGVIKGTSFY